MSGLHRNSPQHARFEDCAAELAHELRTPLAMILGYVELLETREDDHIRREAPRRIREAAARLESLIDSLTAGPTPELTAADPAGTRSPTAASSP